jgi:gluconate kinase
VVARRLELRTDHFFDKRLLDSQFAILEEPQPNIDDYIVEHNQDPKPFQWTATAESIFAKLEAGLI